MKHLSTKHWLFSTMLLAATMGLTACSDKSVDEPETPVTPVTPTTPSTVDSKKWDLDQYMDTVNYKPGNDFAMYCWGKWYQTAEDKSGWVIDGQKELKKSEEALTDYVSEQLEKDMQKLAQQSYDGAAKLLRAEMEQIETCEKENTTESLWKAIALYLNSGRRNVITFDLSGNVKGEGGMIAMNISQDATTFGHCMDENLVTNCMAKLGYDEEAIQKTVNGIKSFVLNMTMGGDLSQLPEDMTPSDVLKVPHCQPLAASTRGGAAAAQIVADILGVKTDQVYYETNETYDPLSTLEKMPEGLYDIMKADIALDIMLADRELLAEYTQKNGEDMAASLLSTMIANLNSYALSKEFCEKYVTAEMRTLAEEKMEELRSVMASRMDRSTWLTTGKDVMKDKLNKMKFNIFYPDNWYSEGLPELAGNSLYEDVMTLRQSKMNMTRKLLASSDYRKEVLNMNYAGLNTGGMSASDANAFYDPTTNTANILPAYFLKPFYDAENSDACFYASVSIMGHEITHGFDSNGVMSDAGGVRLTTSLLGGSDQAAFEKRGKELTACYDKLNIGPDMKEVCNGDTTLAENIADLGGVEMALEAYTNKLTKEGYTGDELVKQQKRFFVAYANLWRQKVNEEQLVKAAANDDHAPNYTRVIGVTKNIDKWCELFGVKEGDKHYVKPEERVHIW